jgi:hypothetical protein
MRYYVTVEGRTFEVDLTEDTPRIDGESVPAELARIPGGPLRHLLEGGRSHAVVVRRGEGDRWDVHMDGERFDADVVDARTRAIRAMTGKGGGDWWSGWPSRRETVWRPGRAWPSSRP